MSPGPWPGQDGSSRPPQHVGSSINDDEQMVRHLASKYSATQLSQFFRNVGVLGPVQMTDDRASILSTQTYASSALSDDPASIFDSGASMKSFSDTASIFSTTSSKAAGRPSACLVQTQFDPPDVQTGQRGSGDSSPSALLSPTSAQSTESASTPTATTPRQKSSFMCSFCKEVGIPKTCTRKNDLKRHIEDFHHTNAQWVCRYRGCQLVFDWQTAYKAHLKAEHGGSRMSPDEAKVNLCPQVVFACGFENCLQVFEACDEVEAAHIFKDYVTHIVKHFDDGTQSGDWTYSRRMKNLLSQSHVHRAWASSGLDNVSRARLDWDPQASCVLRKRLECRHVNDPALLVHYAISLGSDLAAPPNLPPDFVTPVRDTCAEPGHGALKRAPPHQQDASDQFNFRISRGANPALAQYFNAQRRIYVPGRSSGSRRHTHNSSRGSMPPAAASPPANHTNGLGHYSLLNSRANSANYDAGLSDLPPPPSQMYGGGNGGGGSQSFNLDNMLNQQQQDFMRGDDAQVRSSSPEDIGMADATAAAPQSNMSLPYSGILQQARTPDMGAHAMEQNGPFYQDEARQSAAVMGGDYMERGM